MEHLEECQRLQDRHDDGLCICPELRACEARVRVETLDELRAIREYAERDRTLAAIREGGA